jgi:hypothetical protein
MRIPVHLAQTAASRCVYFWVVESEAWPSSSWIARRSAPAWRRCVAKVWRSACGEISSGRPAARSRRFRRRAIERVVRRPPRALTKSGSPGSVSSFARCRSAARDGRYARSASAAASPNGTIRSRLPFR